MLHLQLTLQVAALPSASNARSPILEWIVIEDGTDVDPAISDLLRRSNLPHTYISHVAPEVTDHRGIGQRNAALDLIQQRRMSGVVYFADDDNALRPELLHSLARVPEDSYTIFPVGNTGYFGFEGPVLALDSTGKLRIEQWCCDFCERRWNVDMGGLAFHSSLLAHQPLIGLSSSSKVGFLESDFLSQIEQQNGSLIILPELLEQVHVWHDHSEPFRRADLYDSSWRTSSLLATRMKDEDMVIRGFSWADNTLPSGTLL